MSRITLSFVFVAAAVLAIGLAANVQADTVLFADTFDGANNADGNYGLNNNLVARQAAGATSYTWARATASAAVDVQDNNATAGVNALNFQPTGNNTNSTAIIQHNFNDLAGSFTIQWDSLPESTGFSTTGGHTRSTWVGIGGDAATAGGLYDPTCDFSLSIRNDGNSQTWQNGYAHSGPIYLFDSSPCTTIPSTKWYTTKMTVTLTAAGFASGASYTVNAWAGPQGGPLAQLDLNGVTGNSYTGTWDASGNNYISISANGTSLVDNFSISTPTTSPEPSTLVLLGMGLAGLLAYAWRKRK